MNERAENLQAATLQTMKTTSFEVGGYVRGEQHAYVLVSGQLEKDIQHFFAPFRPMKPVMVPASTEKETSCSLKAG